MSHLLHQLKGRIIDRMTKSHLAGPELVDAVQISGLAHARGWSSTLAYWSGPTDTPSSTSEIYIRTLNTILERAIQCYLSVKVTAINYDFGVISELLQVSDVSGVRIHFDAMDPASAEPTFALLERALKVRRNLGCTLPSRWRRSVQDVSRVIEYGIPVRIVKGQWPDPLDRRRNAHQGYMEIIRLLAGKASLVAVATHDRSLARDALRCLKGAGTTCEMEQLSSLPQNCAAMARSLQVPIRVYIPFGYPSLPYDIWQVRARPQIVGWVLRDAIAGKHRHLSVVH
ncbi:MAG TPA: hypothetical protein VL126_02085 [Bacteroidota bacterium]|nr:hypothetical protein [Bacteroidota bacterium]